MEKTLGKQLERNLLPWTCVDSIINTKNPRLLCFFLAEAEAEKKPKEEQDEDQEKEEEE